MVWKIEHEDFLLWRLREKAVAWWSGLETSLVAQKVWGVESIPQLSISGCSVGSGARLEVPIPARVDCGEEDMLISLRAPDSICAWSWGHNALQGEGRSLGPFAPSCTSMVAMPGAWGTGSGVC